MLQKLRFMLKFTGNLPDIKAFFLMYLDIANLI